MRNQLKQSLKIELTKALARKYPGIEFPSIDIETPMDKQYGDFSCNIAMRMAKVLKRPALLLAQEFIESAKEYIKESSLAGVISRIEPKVPGFINFFISMDVYQSHVAKIIKENVDYGRLNLGRGVRYQIEFVSANPTGPLSIAHARQAAVGDSLGNILAFLGVDVVKEYYVNDEGNQINLLGESVAIRAEELLTKQDLSGSLGDGHYQGGYIKDIAQMFIERFDIPNADRLNGQKKECAPFAVQYLMEVIKKDLEDFRVHFDQWTYQSKVAPLNRIKDLLEQLMQKGCVEEKDNALWFRSTDFGDDKDRVVKKSDGTYTYLTPDIVYHKDKFERGFQKVINIWGPDHHGYIARLTACVQALGYKADQLRVLIVQLATIYRAGTAVSMSTRKGQFISLREVVDEVGVDAARYFFLMRHIKMHLDFDLELAKKQTPENPVFYIQYAHARISSIQKKAEESEIQPATSDFSRLTNEEEIDLIKGMAGFSESLTHCFDQLDPYPLVNYLQDLATLFHKFYDRYKVVQEDKALAAQRLALTQAVKIVLRNGLKLLGLNTPEKM